MGKKRRTRADLVRVQDEAFRRLMLGDSVADIAHSLGISERQTYNYLKDAEERQKAELKLMNNRASVSRQFVVLDYALQEAIQGYERSKRPEVTKATKVERTQGKRQSGGGFGGDGEGEDETGVGLVHEKVSSGKVEKESVGNPLWIDRILKASREIRELLGMDAEKVQKVLVKGGEMSEEENESFRNLSAEELYRKYRDANEGSAAAERK